MKADTRDVVREALERAVQTVEWLELRLRQAIAGKPVRDATEVIEASVQTSKALRRALDSLEKLEPVAFMVKHGDYIDLWTARREKNAWQQVGSLRVAYPDDTVTLVTLYALDSITDPSEEEG